MCGCKSANHLRLSQALRNEWTFAKAPAACRNAGVVRLAGDRDLRSAAVDGVADQFLDEGSATPVSFAGRDLSDDAGWQYLDVQLALGLAARYGQRNVARSGSAVWRVGAPVTGR